MDEPLTPDHSFTAIGAIDETDIEQYNTAAEQYIAERGVEFQEWKSKRPSAFPYAILHPGRMDIYANTDTRTSTDFKSEQPPDAARKIVEALGLLEFISEARRREPIVICSSSGLRKRFQGPIEKIIEELREKHKKFI